MDALAEEGRLQAVRDETRNFLVQDLGLLAQGAVEGARLLNGLLRGEPARNDLDKRHQVRRVEGVADDQALGLLEDRGDLAGRKTRGRGGEERMGRSVLLDGGPHPVLDLQALRAVFRERPFDLRFRAMSLPLFGGDGMYARGSR